MVKIGKKKLRMSSGEIRNFRSEQARDDFERFVQALKHNPKFKAMVNKKRGNRT